MRQRMTQKEQTNIKIVMYLLNVPWWKAFKHWTCIEMHCLQVSASIKLLLQIELVVKLGHVGNFYVVHHEEKNRFIENLNFDFAQMADQLQFSLKDR